MKTFSDYLTEAEYLAENPAVGDVFELEIAREEIMLESYVVDIVEDGIVIEADDTMMRILTHVGYLNENSLMRPADDTTSPINGRKDARRYNFETSPDTDLEEQQTGSSFRNPRLAGLEDELNAATGAQSAQAATTNSLDQEADKFRQRAKDGQVGTSRKWSQMSDIEKRELQSQGFGPKPPTNEADASTDPFSMDDTDAWANKIRKTVPKTRIDTTNWTDEQRYSHDKKTGKFQGPGGFDEWKANRASRTQPQPVTPSTTVPTNEAKYQGREVPLGKKMAGDVKKSKVYVRGPKGNVVKVNFGDPNMTIKKSNPARRKSFRARHNCDNPGPRWKARYWSCRSW
jgi:hypothetical protein